jgi:AraC family transcriptional regulator
MLLEFEPAAARALLPGLSPDAPAYFPAHVLDRLCGAIDRETRRGDAESLTALRGLSLCLASEVSRLGRDSRDEASPPRWLLEAEALLRSRSAEDLRLGRLASVLGVPPVRLAAAFRRRFQCSVGDYLLRTRLARARRMLAESRAPISQIAVDCGFFDQSHFSRAFKKHHRMSPGAFRRSRA